MEGGAPRAGGTGRREGSRLDGVGLTPIYAGFEQPVTSRSLSAPPLAAEREERKTRRYEFPFCRNALQPLCHLPRLFEGLFQGSIQGLCRKAGPQVQTFICLKAHTAYHTKHPSRRVGRGRRRR